MKRILVVALVALSLSFAFAQAPAQWEYGILAAVGEREWSWYTPNAAEHVTALPALRMRGELARVYNYDAGDFQYAQSAVGYLASYLEILGFARWELVSVSVDGGVYIFKRPM